MHSPPMNYIIVLSQISAYPISLYLVVHSRLFYLVAVVLHVWIAYSIYIMTPELAKYYWNTMSIVIVGLSHLPRWLLFSDI